MITKVNSSHFKNGYIPWNKGKIGIKTNKKGGHLSLETREKMKGRIPWNKGKILGSNPEHSKRMKGRLPWCAGTKGMGIVKCWNKGKKTSWETRLKQSLSHAGEKSCRWQGGKSFEIYPLGWNRTFKEQIRRRDGYKCSMCGVPESECIIKLHIHHIDYDKKNIDPKNLITLCNSCHGKTNIRRGYWMDYFRNAQIAKIQETLGLFEIKEG